jgi:glycosyltransferase involved in cell wall biosynthesis
MSTTSPLISIITVVYNGEKYLQQTIDSVYNQTYKNIEYIIIDGGSTDNTLEIVEQNKDKISKWVSEPDDGLYDAMNKGIGLATGKLIGTINSDDWYELNAIELTVNTYLSNQTAQIIHANRYDVYPDNSKKEYKFNPSSFKFKFIGMTYSHPSIFATKEVYQRYSYNTSLKSLSDYQFILKAYLNNNKFVHIPKPIVNFRLGGISSNISLLDTLKEGYLARKIAGMGFFENVFALFIRFLVGLILIIKKRKKYFF